MIGHELQRIVAKGYGKGADLRVVHPMDTYRRGRSTGRAYGICWGASIGIIHEIVKHDGDHMGLILLGLAIALGVMLYFIGNYSEPNKIASDIRRSVDIYKDEK